MDFILWLIYGHYMQLQPNAVAVTTQCVRVAPEHAMPVKGERAALVIEIPSKLGPAWPPAAQLLGEYPPGRLSATLYRRNGTTVRASNHNEIGVSKTSLQISLTPDGGFAKGDEFVSLSLCASPPVPEAIVRWRRIGL